MKKRTVINCHRQPERWRRQVRLYGTARQHPSLPERLPGGCRGLRLPQHSIALMRERDIKSVMENDTLKVNLYRQHEQIQKRSYPVIKSDPEKAVEDLHRYMEKEGADFDVVLFDLPGTLRSEGVIYTISAIDYIFVPLKADNIVMQSSL